MSQNMTLLANSNIRELLEAYYPLEGWLSLARQGVI